MTGFFNEKERGQVQSNWPPPDDGHPPNALAPEDAFPLGKVNPDGESTKS